MNEEMHIIEDGQSKTTIPKGYAAVTVRSGSTVPRQLLHNGSIIPHYVKKDLYDKIQTALSETGLDRKGNTHHDELTLCMLGNFHAFVVVC